MRAGVRSTFQSPRRLVLAVVLAAVAGLLTTVVLKPRTDGASSAAAPTPSAAPLPAPVSAVPAALEAQVTKIATKPGRRALRRALALVDRAHTAVVAPDEPQALASAAALALHAHAPLIVAPLANRPAHAASESPSPAPDPADSTTTLRRLGVVRALVVGRDLEPVARRGGAQQIIRVPANTPSEADVPDVVALAADAGEPRPPRALDRRIIEELSRRPVPPPRPTGVAVLVAPDASEAMAAVVAARAVGHQVFVTPSTDLRADAALGARLARITGSRRAPRLVLTGTAFDAAVVGDVARHAAVAARGLRLPHHGQLIFGPDATNPHHYVALYGVPQSPALGALGEQPLAATIARIKRLARQYAQVVGNDTTVVPCFEIIATVASGSAGPDGNYSTEQPVAALRRVVSAAGEAGIYVLLDLQPGRADFLTQAKRYRALLQQPHVGLALDPEWRLGPRERHLQQIGSVSSNEINQVLGWLADLTEHARLPQKLVVLHQFRVSMLPQRAQLDTARSSLAYVIQMDGQGSQGQKLATWRAVLADPPAGVRFGWKNFHDEDQPLRSVAQTMALEPRPVFVSYQ